MAGLSEAIIQRALSRQPQSGRMEAFVMADIRRKMADEREKSDLLADPTKIDNAVASMLGHLSPVSKKAKKHTQYATKVEALDAAIPEGHPMKGFGGALQDVYMKALASPEYKGKTAGEILMGVTDVMLRYSEKPGESVLEKSFKFKREKDAGWFGLGGEDSTYRRIPGYDDWLEHTRSAEKEAEASQEWLASFDELKTVGLLGAGIGGGIGAFTGPGALAGAAGGAAGGIGFEAVFHPVRKLLRKTEWYNANYTSGSTMDMVQAKAFEYGPEIGVAMGGLASGLRKAFQKTVATADDTGKALTTFQKSGAAIDLVDLVKRMKAEGAAFGRFQSGMKQVYPDIRRITYKEASQQFDRPGLYPPGIPGPKGPRPEPTGPAEAMDLIEKVLFYGKGKWMKVSKTSDMSGPFTFGLSRAVVGPSGRVLVTGEGKKAIPFGKTAAGMYQDLTDAGAEKVLQLTAKTGKFNQSVVKVFGEEKTVREVIKNEVNDYAEILAGKKAAGKRVHATDKARVVLQDAGYDPAEIATFNSKKVVRLAEKIGKVQEQTKGLDEVSRSVVPTPEEFATELSAIRGRIDKLREGVETLSTKAGTLLQTLKGGIREVGEESDTLTNFDDAFSFMKAELSKVKAEKLSTQIAKATEIPDPDPIRFEGIGEELFSDARAPINRSLGFQATIAETSDVAMDVAIQGVENIAKEKGLSDQFNKWYNSFALGREGPKEIEDLFQSRMKDFGFSMKEGEWSLDLTKTAPKAQEELVSFIKNDLEYRKIIAQGQVKELKDLFNPKLLGKLALSGLVIPIASFLSPDEAEAAGLDTLARGLFKPIANKIATAATEAEKIALMKAAKPFMTGAVHEGQKVLPRMAEQINVAKDAVQKLGNVAKAVIRRKKLPFSFDKMMSPYAAGGVFYAEGYNPAVQLGHAQTIWGTNSNAALNVFKNIMKDVPGYKSAQSKVATAMEPLVDQYHTVQAYRNLDYRISVIDSRIKKMTKEKFGKRVGPKTKDRLENTIQEQEAARTLLIKERDGLKGAVDSFDTEYKRVVQGLAEEHSSVRIALAAEDTTDYTFYPFLKGKLSYEEEAAVGHIKAMMENYAERLLKSGHKVIEERPFMHHAFHPKYSEARVAEMINSIGVDSVGSIPFSKMHHRAKFSYMMMPDIGYTMQKYIPDVERRIQVSSFWRSGWKQHTHNPIVRGNPALASYWRRIEAAYSPSESTGWNKWMNRYAMLETMRLIGFAPATGFKHAFKNIGTWGQLGFRNAVSHIPEAFGISFRNWLNSYEVQNGFMMNKLKTIGINPKAQSKVLDEYARAYTHQFRIMNHLSDMEFGPVGPGFGNTVDRLLYEATDKTAAFIKMVEAFDRSHSFTAALDMAAKRGMTAKQATYGIYDTILKNNFLGGGLNPSWMKNPTVRSLFLFQNTPFKLMERRIVTAMRAGKDLKAAWGVIKNQDLAKTLDDMRGLRNYIHAGEQELKKNLIADALFKDRDAFGTPLTQQFMRELLYGGLVIMGLGSVLDANFEPHTIHIPFLSTFGGDKPQLATSPFVSAAYKAMHDLGKRDEDIGVPEFLLTEFLGNWMGNQQYIPQTFKKVLRISEGDIPEIYKDSPMKYFFSVPSKH